jgi:hypothetical protein
MNPIPDDELLSAYLDGELSEADRARAERLLAEQPEARQLLEDLRAIRGGFEGLPAHRLEQDFPARVLRGAEREMLADESSQAADEAPAEGHRSAIAPSPPAAGQAPEGQAAEGQAPRSLQRSFTIARWRRPMAWAGLALAAGLLLMVFDRNRQAPNPRDQLAHAPSAGGEMRAANEPASPADAAPHFARDPASAQAGRDAPAKAEKRLDQEAIREGDAALADKPAGLGGRAAGRPESAAEVAAPKAAAAMPAPRGDVAKTAGQKPAPAPAAGPAPASRSESLELRQSEMTRNEAQAAELSLYDVEFKQDGKLVSEPLGENTLIVWCDVDADVADQPEFRQMLASNQIAWEPDRPIDWAGKAAPSDRTPAIELKSGDKKKVAGEAGDEGADKKSRGAAAAGASAQQQRSDRERRLRRLAEPRSGDAKQQTFERAQAVAETLSESDSDYVLVEATEEQLKAVLTEIDRHPEMFLSVNVEPAAEVPAQQAYRSYNRGRASLPQDKTARLSKDAREAKPKEAGAAAAVSEKEAVPQAGVAGKTQLGRAQRVVILQQSVQTSEETAERGKSDLSDAGSAKQEAQTESLPRKDRGKQSALGAKAKAATQEAMPAKPKALAAPTDSTKPDGEAPPAESGFGAQAGRGYQQALFIFRRVSSPEADSAPVEAGKQPQ